MELEAKEPLSLLAGCIESCLAVEHCAIEYTTASGHQGWAASSHENLIKEAVLKTSGQEELYDRRVTLQIPSCARPLPDAAENGVASGLSFLVNTPLMLTSGTLVGRLWLAGSNPGALSPARLDQIQDFARVASEMIYQQSRISRLLDAEGMSGTGSWTWRASNGRVYGSTQFYQGLGIADCECGLSPSKVLQRIRKEDRSKVIQALRTAIETRSPCSMELQIGDGHSGSMHVIATMRIDVDLNGKLVGAFGTLQDITDHKRVEQLDDQNRHLAEALRVANDVADQQRNFVSMVSHEFRTPLAIIDGNAHRMQRLLGDDKALERAHAATSKIRSAVKRLTGVIDRLLCAGRFETGRIALTHESLDLGALLKEVSTTQLEIAPSRQIELNLDHSETAIVGDRKLLHHVFTNLISNALKYSPGRDKIWVSSWLEDEAVVVSVRDEGLGIPADELVKIYDRFFRARTSAGIVGTGYGLHIVKEFVELHGGSIHLTSKEGVGSTFSVQLPVNGSAE